MTWTACSSTPTSTAAAAPARWAWPACSPSTLTPRRPWNAARAWRGGASSARTASGTLQVGGPASTLPYPTLPYTTLPYCRGCSRGWGSCGSGTWGHVCGSVRALLAAGWGIERGTHLVACTVLCALCSADPGGAPGGLAGVWLRLPVQALLARGDRRVRARACCGDMCVPAALRQGERCQRNDWPVSRAVLSLVQV